MLDKFTKTAFGQEVTRNCTTRFLKELPERTRLVVMFGLGSKLKYVQASFELFRYARGGQWRRINEVSYTDGKVVVVHVEHFKGRNHVPRWLGEQVHVRSELSEMAARAVALALQDDLQAYSSENEAWRLTSR
jgi:hypothetical protein